MAPTIAGLERAAGLLQAKLRTIAGVTVILFGVYTLAAMPMGHGQHGGHGGHAHPHGDHEHAGRAMPGAGGTDAPPAPVPGGR